MSGDLHDIGKNLVAMMIEGNGWEVIDLGVDVSTDKFLKAIAENPDAVIGLSALLTTTMENMKNCGCDQGELFRIEDTCWRRPCYNGFLH